MLFLGYLYTTNGIVEKSPATSAQWYQMAAERGNVEAMKKQVFNYSYGLGVEKDENVAGEWLKKAAETGDAEAMVDF